MSDEANHGKLVYVSTRGARALAEPTFVVRVGEKFYLTFGAWEYDERLAETYEERHGCAAIRELFEKSPDKTEAAPVPPHSHVKQFIAIKPPRRGKQSGDANGDTAGVDGDDDGDHDAD